MKTTFHASGEHTRDGCAPRLVAALLLAFIITPALAADTRTPDRHELWVPNKHWAEVLKQHPSAVMLTPEQYEALVRDAGKIKAPDTTEKQATTAVVESMKFTAAPQPGDPLLRLHGDITLRCLTDDWTHATASLPWINLASASVDGSIVIGLNETPGSDTKLVAKDAAPTQRKLFVKGKGTHHITCDILVRLHMTSLAGAQRLNFQTVNAPAVLEVTLPANASVFDTQCSYIREDGVVKFLLHSSGKPETRGIHWSASDFAGQDAPGTRDGRDAHPTLGIRPDQQSYGIAACAITDHSIETQWDLYIVRDPAATTGDTFTFVITPPEAIVLSVEGAGIAKWEQQGAKLAVTVRPGERTVPFRAVLRTVLDLQSSTGILPVNPAPAPANPMALDQMTLAEAQAQQGIQSHPLPMLKFTGAIAQDYQASITSIAEGLALLAVQGQAVSLGTLLHWNPERETLALLLRKAEPRVVADVDAHIHIGRDNVDIDRTLAIQTDSPVNELRVTLPEGEEFQSTAKTNGLDFDWKRAEQTLTYTWPNSLRPGQQTTLSLKTRKRTITDTATPKALPSTIPLHLAALAIPDAKKLAGYIALDYDPAWRVTIGSATGLEERDARVTPVKGKLAWFALRSYALDLTLQRREPIFDTQITAYALPRAKTIEIEGQLTLDISEAPLRKLSVQLDKTSAPLVRFTSPLVGEQTLDAATGVWSLVLRREMLGRVPLRFRLSLPAQTNDVATATENGTRKTEHETTTKLTSLLPTLQIPASRRSQGVWVIEANTDTELTFEPHAMQPLDVLRAPAIDDYQPRHRVVAAFEYLPQSGTGILPGIAPPSPQTPANSASSPKTDNGKRETESPSLRLNASRHAPSELAALVVSHMGLISVLGADGSTRHQASLVLQHSGEQFLNVQLPADAQLLSIIADAQPVKPVRGPNGSISIPLPPTSANRPDLPLRLLYETPAQPWNASGTRPLQPPTLASDVPILATDWQVYAPDGYSFKKVATQLEQEGTGYAERLYFVNMADSSNYTSSGINAPAKPRRLGFYNIVDWRQHKLEFPWAAHVRNGWSNNDMAGDSVSAMLPNYIREDPYEIAIKPRREEKEKAKNLEAVSAHQRSRMLNQVSEAWENKVPITGSVSANAGQNLSTKMKQIIFPKVIFSGASVDEAIEYLRVKSRDLDTTEPDPTKRGVNIILKAGDTPSNASITLDLKDVPMEEALRYVTELAGMKYKVESNAILVVPVGESTTELYTKAYSVPSDFLIVGAASEASAGAAPADFFAAGSTATPQPAPRMTAKDLLLTQGIPFPEGASAVFNPITNQLIVKSSQPNLDMIETLVQSVNNPRWQEGPFETSDRAQKEGLLSLDLDLPVSGQRLHFHGAQAPGSMALRYVSWERQMTSACVMLMLGALGFLRWGRRWPWLSSALVFLLLALGVSLVAEDWQPLANGLLLGWFAALAGWLAWRLVRALDGWFNGRRAGV